MSHGSNLNLEAGSLLVTLVSLTTQEAGGGCSKWVGGDSARCHHLRYLSLHTVSVLAQLERGNFFSSAITKHSFFPSVHDAVLHISRERHQASVSTQPCCPQHGHGEGSHTNPSLSASLRWTTAPECSPSRGRRVLQEPRRQGRLCHPDDTNLLILGPRHPDPHQPLWTLSAGALPCP